MPDRVNAADPIAVKARQRTENEAREQAQDELRELLKLPEFRRYVWRHITVTCAVLQSPSQTNGTIQSWNCGMQDVGRKLWDEIKRLDPAMIPLMMTESIEAQR
jgi:hypothetical protein